MKNNLTPTRIVNKNGVSTTVYRKPPSGSQKAPRFPPLTPGHTAPKDHAEWLNARLTKLPHISDETMLNASKSFFVDEIGELSYRLLSSGTSTGQRLVVEALSFYVGRVAEHMHETGKTSVPMYKHTGSLTHGEIMRRWNYGNIREEANISPDGITQDELDDLRSNHSLITAGESSYDDISEEDRYRFTAKAETYWRGVSALTLCFDFAEDSEEADKEWESFEAFISWAAAHDDIGKVIRIAKKHRTIIPEKLTHLMEAEASGVHDSMTTGWL